MDRDGYFLEAVSGVDWLEKQQLEVIYDYNRLGGEHCRVTVRTRVPRNNPGRSHRVRRFSGRRLAMSVKLLISTACIFRIIPI